MIPSSALKRSALALVASLSLALPVTAARAETRPLVSADWLKDRLGDPQVVVVDVRSALDGGGAKAFAQSHIPGAVHADYEKAGWRVTRAGVEFNVPDVHQLEALIGGLGISEDSHVVVVPAGVHATDFGQAARVYWTLKTAGHAKLSILDGGHAAWVAGGNRIATGPGRVPEATIYDIRLDGSATSDTAAIARAVSARNATLIDARPNAQFRGLDKSPRVAAYGRLPGARNIEHTSGYDAATNRLKPRAELERLFADVGDGPVVAYCNTAHWAATTWFVLSEVLGRPQTSLYVGSMLAWASDPNRPVESERTKLHDLMARLGLTH